jgi:hypothetical protein
MIELVFTAIMLDLKQMDSISTFGLNSSLLNKKPMFPKEKEPWIPVNPRLFLRSGGGGN